VGVFGSNSFGKTAIIEAFEFFKNNMLNMLFAHQVDQSEELNSYLKKGSESLQYEIEFNINIKCTINNKISL
jgi:AAA15 family ATPase/GTPase